ncbi:hypothetical protein ARHIZOSPH14_14300 [Agromyces rhizosphaerae]|uniref:DUF6457 domain-containing protein n=1 Tax=Agromyces rhizosphaerae TaxID=88374 RepID=A0A9W6D0F4_9MICO|nr:DUF6457 domain-containing protein [Agromyces rhizosphaerae]GLI27188.1 hypothetical protein ARHIZOSPH14_14300 [Agromyces rhizosphaerae]
MADDAPEILDRWWTELSAALGVEDAPGDIADLLSLAGDAAHRVVRPAAPLTTFLVGYAAARAGGDDAALRRAIDTARELAARHDDADH